jgi:hypothetical protein
MTLFHNIVQTLAGSFPDIVRYRSVVSAELSDVSMRSCIGVERSDVRFLIAFLKKPLAASISRCSLNKKSTVQLCLSTGRQSRKTNPERMASNMSRA